MRYRGALVLLVFCATAAWADDKPRAPPANSTLLLEIWIDGSTDHTVVPVFQKEGKLFMNAADLRKEGVQFSAAGDQIDLGTIGEAKLDETTQRLLLTVAAAKLAVQHFDLYNGAKGQADGKADDSNNGAVLRYSLSSTVDDVRHPFNSSSIGGTGTLDLFGPLGLFSNSGFINASGDVTAGARLDSYLQFDSQEDLTKLVVGDAISGGPSWARNVRFGGVQYASDFTMRPDLVTMPLPNFFGQSQVPTTVDVFSGATKVFEETVQPGPFELKNLPITTGGGMVTVVTQDVLGRQTSQNLSLYTDVNLLKAGLSSYDFDAGFLRTNYGITSLGYDTPVTTGTYRRGISDTVTLEAHGEGAPKLGLVSGGAAVSLGTIGMMGADVAASDSSAGAGYLASITGQAGTGKLQFNFSGMAASNQYRDLASIGAPPPPLLRYTVGANSNWGSFGTLGLGWLGTKPNSGDSTQYITASYSVQLPGGGYLSATGLQDVKGHDFDAQLSFTLPLDNGAIASVSGQTDGNSRTGMALYQKNADLDGGLGYRVLGQWDADTRAEGDVNWIGQHVALDGAASVQSGQASLRGDADGALVLLDGSVFAIHDPGDAVALVETGKPDVRVYRENRLVGKSDDNGELLLAGLGAYAPNHIAVEPRDYPFDVVIDQPDRLVRPHRRAGLIVNMAPIVRHPIIAVITRGIDMPMPLGARVFLAGSTSPLLVGHDGQVFIPDLQHGINASVELGTQRCQVHIEPQSKPGQSMPRTDPLLCLREASGAY